MANPIYMTMGMHVENGVAKTPTVKYHSDRNEADRQYHLFCAAASTSSYDVDTAVIMTVSGFMIESKTWEHGTPAPEPEN